MISSQGRVKQEYLTNTVSVKEYAYREDTNFPIRGQMEDGHFHIDDFLDDNQSGVFAVLDGHGGTEVVEYVTKVLPDLFYKEFHLWNASQPIAYFEHIFKKVDDQLRLVGASEIGSTCCFTLIKREGSKRMMYVANLGDTRAVLNVNDKAVRVTVDHKSSNEDEQMRVRQQGGTILRNRVNGQLAVTRAFGDLDLKTQGVSVKPDLKSIELTKDHKYLIMASDGLWDVVDDSKAIELTKDLANADLMTKVLLEQALKSGSKDNISILILVF